MASACAPTILMMPCGAIFVVLNVDGLRSGSVMPSDNYFMDGGVSNTNRPCDRCSCATSCRRHAQRLAQGHRDGRLGRRREAALC